MELSVNFFTQYLHNVCVTAIVDCSITDYLFYVMWKIVFWLILNTTKMISAVVKLAGPVALILYNRSLVINKTLWRRVVSCLVGES